MSLLSTKKAAKYVDCHVQTIKKRYYAKKLQGTENGGRLFFNTDDLKKLREELGYSLNRKDTTPHIIDDVPYYDMAQVALILGVSKRTPYGLKNLERIKKGHRLFVTKSALDSYRTSLRQP